MVKKVESKPTILVIEDDRPIRSFIGVSLSVEGYTCLEANTGKLGISMIASHNPDVVILDLGLPDIDGIEVIQTIRQWSNVKIIVVSARGREKEKVIALDAGADDFITKPFSIGELMARIRVALRQSQYHVESMQPCIASFKVGALEIDYVKRKVMLDENEVHLTPMEYNLLLLMARHAGKVLTHHFILKEVWGVYTENDTRSLRVFMANMRRKIEKEPARPRYILTEVGVGYRLADE